MHTREHRLRFSSVTVRVRTSGLSPASPAGQLALAQRTFSASALTPARLARTSGSLPTRPARGGVDRHLSTASFFEAPTGIREADEEGIGRHGTSGSFYDDSSQVRATPIGGSSRSTILAAVGHRAPTKTRHLSRGSLDPLVAIGRHLAR